MGDRAWGRSGRSTLRAPAPATTVLQRALTPAEVAWVALLPCAAAALAAIVLLGPPLGHALFPPVPAAEELWPPGWEAAAGHPVPVKQARYLLAVLAPLLLAGIVLASARRTPALRPRTIRAIVGASQAAVLAFVVFAFLGQYDVVLVSRQLPHLYELPTLVVAVALVPIGVLAMRRREIAQRVAALARETAARRAAGLAIAAGAASIWLVQGVFTDALAEDPGGLDWTMNDVFGVLDGRVPLVDLHLLYAKLLPYPTALVLLAFGTTAIVYTLAMTLLSGLALLGVYAVLRRLVHSSLLALGLFVPFVAIGDVRHSMTLTAMWPMRYGGAYLMAWLTLRHLDRRGPRHAWALFLLGSLVAVDDMEFGLAALVATVAALLCARPPRLPRDILRLGIELAAGALGAVAIVALPTLAFAGALPDPAVLMEWPRIFGRLGAFTFPMPLASLHLAIYATFVAAIAVAAVRLRRAARDALLTGMLAWSGVFGLLAGSYYVGRSDTLKLISMFSAWGFALALLTIAAVRALAADAWRSPSPAQLLVLFGFALSICSLAQLPLPQDQISRLTAAARPPAFRPRAERFVRAHTRRGEKVAILVPMGYRIAYDLGLDNVSPYGTEQALATRWQIQAVIDAMRREHAHKLFLREAWITAPQLQLFANAGFQQAASERGQAPPIGFVGFIEMADA